MGRVFLRPASPAQFQELGVRINPFQPSRDKSREGRADGLHAQGFHAVQDVVLEGHLVLVPRVGKSAVMVDDVAHPLPGQVGGTHMERVNFLPGKPQLPPNSGADRFRCRKGQGKVDAVQGHPVYFPLPAVPCPVGRRVPVSYCVEVVVVPHRGDDLPPGGIRKAFRPADAFIFPADHAQVVGFQIVVKSAAESHSAASANGERAAGGFRFKDVAAILPGNGFQFQGSGRMFQFGNGPDDDFPGGVQFFRIQGIGRREEQTCLYEDDPDVEKGRRHIQKYGVP